jgi:Lon protease-like protein
VDDSLPSVALPLVPVADLVHFPRTELILDLEIAPHRQLVRHLLAQAPEQRLLGVVLVKPAQPARAGVRAVFGAGTCARVTRVEPLAEEGVRLHLQGTCRFAIEEETRQEPFREALVRLVEEPELDEGEPEVRQARRRLGNRLMEARSAFGDGFVMSAEELREALAAPFEELVNRIAHGLDVPALRKLELLACPLPERALEVLGILRSRIKLAHLLAPYRRLAAAVESN